MAHADNNVAKHKHWLVGWLQKVHLSTDKAEVA